MYENKDGVFSHSPLLNCNRNDKKHSYGSLGLHLKPYKESEREGDGEMGRVDRETER